MTTHLMSLSNEMLSSIARLLLGSDIKSLRACLLSAARQNIDVFKAVTKHPYFSHRVREIIWEDIKICPPWNDTSFDTRLSESARAASFEFYETLYLDHESIMDCAEDITTLRIELKSLPNLKQITLAIEPYHYSNEGDEYPYLDLNNPQSFKTPLLRSIPVGVSLPHTEPKLRWNDSYPGEREYLEPWAKAKKHFRELCIVLEEMTKSKLGIQEFVVQRFNFSRGISHRMFISPSFDTMNATIAFQRLKRLDIALDVRWAEDQNWMCFRSGVLREILAGATKLQHLALRTNLGYNPGITYGDADVIVLSDALTPKS